MEKKRKKIEKERRGGWAFATAGKGVALGGLIAWLFFQSVWGFVCVPFCVGIVWKREKKRWKQKQTEREQEYFIEYLGFLKEALLVGYSLEQAVGEGKKGMLTTLKQENFFLQAVERLERKMQVGTSVETAFAEWAEEASCGDIRDFAEVLFIAKRTGGAVQQVIENTEHVIRDKQETLRYIRAALHSREYETKVMKCMPFAMLLYLQLFMADFLEPLYHNPVGVGVMSVVLVVYYALCLMADRVTAVSL